MQQIKQIFLYFAIITWALLLGGMVYTHLVYFPPYLNNLPQSNLLITGPYGLKDENFWMLVHPVAIIATIAALIFNWRSVKRRRYLLIAAGIYALAIFFTAMYFVPELLYFAKANPQDSGAAADLVSRGKVWLTRSWIRGSFLFAGFTMLLLASGNKMETKI